MRSKRFVFAVTFGLLLCGAMSALAGDNDLHTAAKNGDVETVQQLLDAGVPIDATDQRGHTPLMFASNNGHKAVVQQLLAKKAAVDATAQRGHTPLMFASEHGHEAVVQLLLAAGAAADATSQEGWTPLMLAASNGHKAVAKLLIDSGADITTADQQGNTPLMFAAEHGHETVIRLLLAAGAAADATNHKGGTPLMFASSKGHGTVAQLLLAAGAAVDATAQRGHTPLMFAAKHGHETVIRLLLAAGAAADATNHKGWTPLMFASSNGHETVAKLMIDSGAGITTADQQGNTPLMFAASNGHETIIRLLLAAGATADTTNRKGLTPLIVAANHGHEAVIRLLLAAGANVHATEQRDWTPVMFAAQGGHAASMQLLIDSGANVNTTTHQGWSALMIAAQNGHETVAKLLIDSGANVKATSDTQLLGQTLEEAAAWGRTSIVQFLLSRCSDLKKTYVYQMNAVMNAFHTHNISTARLILQSIVERIRPYRSHPLAKALHAIAFTQDDVEFHRLFTEFLDIHRTLGKWQAETKRAIRRGKLKQLTLILELGLVHSLWQLINFKDVSTQTFALVLDYCDTQTLQRISLLNEIEFLLEDLMHKQRPEIAQMLVTHAHQTINLHSTNPLTRKPYLSLDDIVSGVVREEMQPKNIFQGVSSLLWGHKNHHVELLKLFAARGMVKTLDQDQRTRIKAMRKEFLDQVESTIKQRRQLIREKSYDDIERLISAFENGL